MHHHSLTNLPRSLLEGSAAPSGAETCEALLEKAGITIERIVSSGTQPAARYLQDHDEWVLLVQGHAELRVDGQTVLLRTGDTLLLPAGVEHTVLSTSSPAIWLAIHIKSASVISETKDC